MVAICIPWRPTPERQPLLDAVVVEYNRRGNTLPYVLADSDGPVFSRAQAINRAVNRAFADGHEVVVINDADTLCDPESLGVAVWLTAGDKQSRLPYSKYILMTQGQTNLYLATGTVAGDEYLGACSGVLVVHKDTWNELGGFDERYIGWGAEDVEFAIRHQFERIPGTCWGLYHTPDERGALTQANMDRLRFENPGCG